MLAKLQFRYWVVIANAQNLRFYKKNLQEYSFVLQIFVIFIYLDCAFCEVCYIGHDQTPFLHLGKYL